MKTFSMILVCAFALAACGGKQSGDSTMTGPNTTTTNTDTGSAAGSDDAAGGGDGTPCEQEIMLECPEGEIDACMKEPREGDVHKCVAK